MAKSSGLGAFHSLGRTDSLNWRTHLLFAGPAILTGIIFDYPRIGSGPLGAWALLVLMAILVPVVVIELLSQVLGKSTWQKPRPILVGLILLFAGFMRGATFYFVGGAFGLVPNQELVFRLIGGPLYVLASYMVCNYIVMASMDHRMLSSTLTQERENLELSKQNFETQLSSLRLAQMSRVRELLAPAIWELGKLLKDASLSKDASRAIGALRQLNDEVVRPLSHSMIQKFELPSLTGGLSQRARLGQFVLPAKVEIKRTIPLTAFAPFVAVISYSAVSSLLPPLQALIAALGATLILTAELGLIKWLVGDKLVPLGQAVISSIAIGSLLGVSAGVMVTLEFLRLPAEVAPQAFVFFLMTMLVFLMLGVVQMQRNQVTQELEGAVEDLRLLTSQLRQKVWLSQKTLATELHGSVQAALNASALRLAQLADPAPQDLDRVRTDIDTAMQQLGGSDYLNGQSIEELLEQMCELWEASCQIEYRVSEAASLALALDSATAYCTLEVIREATNNALTHGDAKNIEVQITLENEVIELLVLNDGVGSQLTTPGIGSLIYQELALSHELTLGTPTKLWAQIPLSPSGQ